MTRQLLFPDPLQFAVIRIDARAMVEPLKDPIALEAAAMLECRKYLVFLEAPDDLPLPRSKHCRYSMLPVATCLRPADVKKGLTADMVMPIHPNTEHLRGRTPIRTDPLFPYKNCFFWIESELSVRVKVSPGGYDDKGAIAMGAREHLETSRCWMEDFDRLDSFLDGMDAKYAGEPPAMITDVLPYSSTISALPPPHTFDDNSDESDSDVEDSADEDDDAISRFDPEDLAELKGLFSHNPFGWDRDPKAKFLPLVDLWLELEEHLTAAEIPSPVEFYKEQAAITSIMIDSLRRRSVQTPLQAPRALPSFSAALSIEESRVEENDDKYFVPEATAKHPPVSQKHPLSERFGPRRVFHGLSILLMPLQARRKPSQAS